MNRTEFHSMVACLDRQKESVVMTGVVSNFIPLSVVGSFHVALGVGCGDWGVCLYLTMPDAAKLNAELGQILADHAVKG